jgi:hypothetical protein
VQDNLIKAQHYRDQAEKFRSLASQEGNVEARKDLLSAAEAYARLHEKLTALARK